MVTIKKKASVKKKIPNSEVTRQKGFFELAEPKEEKTLNKLLSKRLSAPVVTLSNSEAEVQRRNKLISDFRVRYLASINSFTLRGIVLEVLVFNKCCDDLAESEDLSGYDIELSNILKNIIKELATDNLRLVYIFSSPQIEMIRFINEYYNYLDGVNANELINRAYKDVANEIREWRKEHIGALCI